MSIARNRKITVTADGANNLTGWLAIKRGGIATIENLGGTLSGTVTLQRRGNDGVIVDVTDNAGTVTAFTKAGTYTLNPSLTPGDYRLNLKSGAYVSGTWGLLIEGR